MPLYFAYGSNMDSEQLRSRCPSGVARGVALLPFHALRFHKRSKDGSGKADAHETGRAQDVVQGVLFELTDDDLIRLDSFEGGGYERTLLEVSGEHSQRAFVYRARASSVETGLLPTREYLAHILAGANEHGLPPGYIATLRLTPTLD